MPDVVVVDDDAPAVVMPASSSTPSTAREGTFIFSFPPLKYGRSGLYFTMLLLIVLSPAVAAVVSATLFQPAPAQRARLWVRRFNRETEGFQRVLATSKAAAHSKKI